MGKGYSVIDSELPQFDASITSSKRFKKMGSQFTSWSIYDVRKALSEFEKYKHFKFQDLNTVREKLYTEWPEFYKILDRITLDHLKKKKMLERSRRHPSCSGYAMRKDPNARPPSIHEGDTDDEEKNQDSGDDSERDDPNVEYLSDEEEEEDSGEEEESEEERSDDKSEEESTAENSDNASSVGSDDGSAKERKGGNALAATRIPAKAIVTPAVT